MKYTLTTCVSAHRNISLLLGRMEARRRVEFVGDSGSTTLVGDGLTTVAVRGGTEVSATRRSREVEGSRGLEAVARRAQQAGPTVRWSSAAARRRPRAAPSRQGRQSGGRALLLGGGR